MTGELEQYQNDRPAWLAHVAPKQAERINSNLYDDIVLAATWNAMPRDYQTATWQHLDEVSRVRVRKVRKEA